LVIRQIIEAAEIKENDTIFEIGPGLGVLTRELIKSPARKVIACETDRKFCEFLRKMYKEKKVKIICNNALVLIPNLSAPPPLKVVSNLPYNIASPAIISLLTVCPTLPKRMVLMVQKEVAERLCARPGDSNRGLLTVFIELFGKIEVVAKVSANLFYPPPQVDSAVILISDIKKIPCEPKAVFKILKAAFALKRKKIKNSLFASLNIPQGKAEEIAKKAGITLDQRPEELTKNQWLKLVSLLGD
jgi:16S rRNA (adenine1518-N6/adenine1519-N6)-dimethyltransferase